MWGFNSLTNQRISILYYYASSLLFWMSLPATPTTHNVSLRISTLRFPLDHHPFLCPYTFTFLLLLKATRLDVAHTFMHIYHWTCLFSDCTGDAMDIPINRTNVIRTAQITPKLMVSISIHPGGRERESFSFSVPTSNVASLSRLTTPTHTFHPNSDCLPDLTTVNWIETPFTT